MTGRARSLSDEIASVPGAGVLFKSDRSASICFEAPGQRRGDDTLRHPSPVF